VRSTMGSKAGVLLLASGGIDSTALIDFYLRQKVKFSCIHFQYCQSAAQSEKEAVEKVCEYFDVESTVIRLDFPLAQRREEMTCRNFLFVLAASSLKPGPTRITLGIHSGSQYYDCTRRFIDDCQRVLDGYFSGAVRVEAPFIDLEKPDIVEYCKANSVPIHLTYSCQRQNDPPCKSCTSCLDRKKFYGC